MKIKNMRVEISEDLRKRLKVFAAEIGSTMNAEVLTAIDNHIKNKKGEQNEK